MEFQLVFWTITLTLKVFLSESLGGLATRPFISLVEFLEIHKQTNNWETFEYIELIRQRGIHSNFMEKTFIKSSLEFYKIVNIFLVYKQVKVTLLKVE